MIQLTARILPALIKDVADTSVHIPLYIDNGRITQDIRQSFQQIRSYILPAHVKHQLVSAPYRLSARNLQHPVRMGSVKIAVL